MRTQVRQPVHNDSGPDYVPGPVLEGMFRRVAHQAARVIHLVHDLVAGIDAGRTADALVLQAVAYIDTGRTHLHTIAAVDTINCDIEQKLNRNIFES